VVALATLAPSIHNTQPWRWRYDSTGSADCGGAPCLRLFADPDRQLAVVDPDGRQLLVSCGAALLFAKLAMRSRGLEPEVMFGPLADALPPRGDVPLATIRAVGRRPATLEETELVAAMRARHTDRRPFLPGGLDRDELAELRRAAEAESAWLLVLDRPDQRIETSVLLARADWQETHDPAYAAELREWTRRTGMEASDGLTREAVAAASDTSRQSEFILRDFDPDHAGAGQAGTRGEGSEADGAGGTAGGVPQEGAPHEVERPTVVAIGTDSDRPEDRLISGEALGRVLLTAAARGAAASPLGQVVDLPATREMLRQATGGTGFVQMLLRVGRPDPAAEPLKGTPRRAVDEVLEVA